MEDIIDYIQKTYNPLALIVYGSFADGSNNANSDFDALVITSDAKKQHDHYHSRYRIRCIYLFCGNIFQAI